MKIFQIGFNRCGTTSLHKFFKKNGLVCVHWADRWLARWLHQNYLEGRPLLQNCDQFDFYSDMEDAPQLYAHILYYKVLDEQYPGSRFILNVRDKNRWLLSRLRFGRYCEEFAAAHIMNVPQTIDLWSKQWDDHILEVKHHFLGRNNLLEFNIESDGIDKLVSFLPEWKLEINNYWNISNASESKYQTSEFISRYC